MSKKIIIGTANFDKKYKLRENNNINERKINEILSFCSKNNIDTIDTASSYGKSEYIIGKYISKNSYKFNIITKYKSPIKSIADQFEKSNSKLKIYPSIILSHDVKEYLQSNYRNQLIKLKSEKKIKKYGVSVYNDSEIKNILKVSKPDIIQLPINILDKRLLKNNLLSRIKDKGIEIHARSIFLRGLLFYPPEKIIKLFPQIKKEIVILQNFAKSKNISIAELSLIWVNSIREIDKIVLGVTSKNELYKNIKILKKNIHDKLFEKINKINITNEKIINPKKWQIKF